MMMTGVPQTVDCGEYCTAFTRTPHQICLIWDDYLPWDETGAVGLRTIFVHPQQFVMKA